MAKNKEEKTNVMRVLEQKKIAYTAHTYPHEEGMAVDGVTVAKSMGFAPAIAYALVSALEPVRALNSVVLPQF